jgi:serine/threonine protein kinase
MGHVYRATDTTLGRQVAIKILPDALGSDPERFARFEREAKTLASLNHPNIRVFDGDLRVGRPEGGDVGGVTRVRRIPPPVRRVDARTSKDPTVPVNGHLRVAH